ncbi:ComEC/Rec2 family competence protein [Aquibium sp. A9E412]|uniref:ComEC/Rec2 family competence protein n=1 Tax=Aquibium sp. A9E412 TaxID=2976767 RepID=UPI0025AEE52D|nr:ComEC/Rec2 family competence protein [Aquibium sp. A9E412]MDN2564696.1 ComEC/Rec2 family competence protein [Aquibium sp. A9E412]
MPGRDAARGPARPRRAGAFGRGLTAAFGREWQRGAAFLCLPVLMGAGALGYFVMPVEPAAHALASGIGLAALLAFVVRDRFPAGPLAAALLAFLAGMAAGQFETARRDTAMLGADVTTRLTGRVVRVERQAGGRYRLTVDVTATERPQLRYAPQRVRLTARRVDPAIRPGTGVGGLVRLMAASGPVRPSGFDFSFESYFAGLGAVGFFLRDPVPVALDAAAPPVARLAAWIETLRLALAERVRARVAGPEGEIAAALVTGVRAGIPEPVNEALRRAGLAHILAISGLHMALFAVTVMGAIRLGCAAFPGFAARRPVKKYAAAAALAACAFYLALSGAAVAAQRSFIMLAVMLAAVLADRAAITMRNLAIAALVILALAPHEIVGPSFQMSFAATAALIAGYAAWNARRERRHAQRPLVERGPAARAARLVVLYAAGLAATSLMAGAATTIFGVWHFQRAAPLGLVANLAAMPIVSLVVMPSAVFALALLPFGLDALPLYVMGKGLAAVIAVAEWCSRNTLFDETGAIPAAAVLALTAALVVASVATTRLRLAALPLAAAGLALIVARDLPDALVAEDGRLVALRMPAGSVAVNRARPNGFLMDNWLRALGADGHVGPRAADRPAPANADGPAPSTPAGAASAAGSPALPPDGRFVCSETLCLARHASGALVVHAADAAAARPHCAAAAVIVVDDATARLDCGRGATVLTKRDLARRGAAALRFAVRDGRPHAIVTYAIGAARRPWHDQRQYGRAARGLPPYRRDD